MHDSVDRAFPSPVGSAPGAIELDYVDGVAGLMPHPKPPRVPRNAPVVVRGWASQPDAVAPRAVRILLDRTNVYDVRLAAEADAKGGKRFVCTIPTAAITPGEHEVRAVVLADDDRWYESNAIAFAIYEPVLAAVEPSTRTARLRIERIVDARPDGTRHVATDGVPLGNHAIVTGWAMDSVTLAPAGGVIVTARGRRYTAECNLPRPDVRAAIGGIGSDRMGFETFVPTGDLGPGDHVARVECFDGERRGMGSTDVVIRIAARARRFPPFAECAPEAPAYAAIVRVRAHGDDETTDDADASRAVRMPGTTWYATPAHRLDISGWADDPWGKPATGVFLELRHASDVAALAPHRIAATCGYHRDAPPHDGAFRIVLPLVHERGRALELALLTLGPDRRVYGRIGLGTLFISGVRAAGAIT